MEPMDTSLSSSDEYTDHQPIETITRGFNQQLHLQSQDDSSSSSKLPATEVGVDEDDKHEDEDEDDNDFTFMLVGGDDVSVEGEKVLEDGQLLFPLFDQKLLLVDGDYEAEEIDELPIQPPVNKIFIPSPRPFPFPEDEESHDGTTGAYCVWSKESSTATSELTKKSNSTGFSKLWRLKERGGRSNSYGRDAFVFFKTCEKKTTTTAASSATADGTFKVNVSGGKAKVVKKGRKGNKSTVSAHEAYLKGREEDRRRSYLPYRPELMGFFTNVHGGLTKNLHPY